MIKDKGHGSKYEGLKVFSSCDVRAETFVARLMEYAVTRLGMR